MKSIEQLKEEQYDLKAKLHEIIELINSEEYFTLSPREKSLIGQQRAGMEMYLNALTNRIYSKDELSLDSSTAMFLPILTSMFSCNWGAGSSKSVDDLKREIEEEKQEEAINEEDIQTVPSHE